MTAFHRGGYRTGINNIIPQIRPGVNAGHNNVRARTHQSIHAKIDAIGRGSHLHSNITIFKGKRAQGGFQCQRIRSAAAVTIGGDHLNVSKLTQGFRQRLYTGCMYPVIITQQYAHNHLLC